MASSYRLRRTAQADLRSNIRTAATDRGWTLTQAARESSVAYSKLTQGMSANRWFLAEEVGALASALGMTTDELMGDSLFKADARGSKFDQADDRRSRGADVGVGNGRALCCVCGTFRRFTVAEIDYARTVMDGHLSSEAGHRLTLPLHCRTCGLETTHAELCSDKSRNHAEGIDHAPTREQEAILKRDALIARLLEFGVDVHFQKRGKKLRAEGYLLGYEYDASKSRWRIEIDPNAPGYIQLRAVEVAWEQISTDDHSCDWDAHEGVYLSFNDQTWARAADDLLEDIQRFMTVEKQRMALSVRDELAAQRSEHATEER